MVRQCVRRRLRLKCDCVCCSLPLRVTSRRPPHVWLQAGVPTNPYGPLYVRDTEDGSRDNRNDSLLPHQKMLPKILRLLIDAHRPEVKRSHLTIGPTAFG